MSEKWDHRFMALAHYVGTWSKDPSRGAGAVIVDHSRVVIGMGYNGFPRGVEDDEERYANRDVKYMLVVHAEVNAILNSSVSTRGATMYTPVYPCNECAKIIVQSGITRLIYAQTPPERWRRSSEMARLMMREAFIVVRKLEGASPEWDS